jgi:hypothetical protein
MLNRILTLVQVHPQQSNSKGHPVDGVLVGGGSLWKEEQISERTWKDVNSKKKKKNLK